MYHSAETTETKIWCVNEIVHRAVYCRPLVCLTEGGCLDSIYSWKMLITVIIHPHKQSSVHHQWDPVPERRWRESNTHEGIFTNSWDAKCDIRHHTIHDEHSEIWWCLHGYQRFFSDYHHIVCTEALCNETDAHSERCDGNRPHTNSLTRPN